MSEREAIASTQARTPGGSEAPPGAADPFAVPHAPLAEVPDDAADTRGRHLRALVGSPLVLIVTAIAAGGALLAAGTQAGFGIGTAAAGIVLLLALLIVWLVASGRAKDDFFNAYAEGRGLTRSNGRTSLPAVTPLLRRGDERYAQEAFSGSLPGDLEGRLAHFTYEEESRDSDGNRTTTYYHFTVVVSELPETAEFIGELALQRRAGFRFMDSAEDVFRKRQRVELESVDADRRYEIFIGERDEMNRARQVFTPTFTVWVAEHCPEGIACELVAGTLVVNVKGHKKTAQELDELCEAAAAIAKRFREEATE